MRLAAMAALLCLSVGCIPKASVTIRGEPVLLSPDDNVDPAAIWVAIPHRFEERTRTGITAHVYWGIYSCWRPGEAGTPECHLAYMKGAPKDLSWPMPGGRVDRQIAPPAPLRSERAGLPHSAPRLTRSLIAAAGGAMGATWPAVVGCGVGSP